MDYDDFRALRFHVNAIIDSIIMNDTNQEVINVHNEVIEIIKNRNNKDQVNITILKIVAQRLAQYKRALNFKKTNINKQQNGKDENF